MLRKLLLPPPGGRGFTCVCWTLCRHGYTKTTECISSDPGLGLSPERATLTSGVDPDKETSPGEFSECLLISHISSVMFLRSMSKSCTNIFAAF